MNGTVRHSTLELTHMNRQTVLYHTVTYSTITVDSEVHYFHVTTFRAEDVGQVTNGWWIMMIMTEMVLNVSENWKTIENNATHDTYSLLQ